MKILEATQDVEMSEGMVAEKFDVELNAQFFRTMTDTLYSFKVRAVIRELSTNAADAMVDTGQTGKPFFVHLPNRMEPFFTVRDYGPGIAKNEVKPVYTTLFKSSRIKSNDHAGCYGLGSKSPFAYTDSFTVTSYFNGMKYIFSLFKDASKCPACVMLGEEPTTEPNGLEVTVPVENVDMAKFYEEAKFVYRTFKVRPTIVGAQITFDDSKSMVSGSCWDLYSGSGTAVAVMGNVCYPLNGANAVINYRYHKFLNANFVFHFNIGEVDIPPAREALSYDKATIANLEAKLQVVENELKTEVSKMIDVCPTMWEASLKYHSLDYAVRCLVDNNIMYKGKKLQHSFYFPHKYTAAQVEIRQFSRVYSSKTKSSGTTSIAVDDKAIIAYNDCPQGSFKRAIEYVNNHTDATVYLISILDTTITVADIEQFIGDKKIDKITDYPLPVVVKAARATPQKRPTDYLDMTTNKMENQVITYNKGEYYLYTDRNNRAYKGYGNGTFYRMSEIAAFLKEYNDLFKDTFKPARILLLKKYDSDARIKKNSMINLYDFIVKKAEQEVLKIGISQELLDEHKETKLHYDDRFRQKTQLRELCDLIDSHGLMVPTDLQDFYDRCRHLDKMQSIYSFCNSYNIKFPTQSGQKIDIKNILTKHPLMSIILSSPKRLTELSRAEISHLVDYLK
jgi:hypothetical protein